MPPPSNTRIREDVLAYGIVALVSALYIAVCAHTPISILANAIHDDDLFIEHGRLLAHAQWLGPFSQFTLMKGPGYPAFLALSAWSGLSISINEAIFNCIAVGGFCLIVERLSGSRVLALTTFVLVLWNPGLLQQRVLREAIYPGQLLLFFAALAYALFCVTRRREALCWGLIAGALLGWLWLTREEGTWIIPGALLLIVGALLTRSVPTLELNLPVISTTAMLLACILSLIAFRFINLTAYGSFVGVDFKEANFKGALEALQSVKVGNPIPLVPVTMQARQKIYAVSPAFGSLQRYLDPPEGTLWKRYGCGQYPWTCGDIAGQWFMWALRDAAGAEGAYQSPARASRFFGEIRSEVDSACRQGLLLCGSSPIPFMPPITEAQMWQIPGRIASALSYLLFRVPPPVIEGPSSGTEAELNEAADFLNDPVHTPLQHHITDNPVNSSASVRLAVGLRAFLNYAYAILMPVVFWPGVVAMLVSIWMMGPRRAATDPILILAVVTWILLISRVVLLALVDVSSFTAVNYLYIAPAYALACIAPLLSLWECYRAIRPIEVIDGERTISSGE